MPRLLDNTILTSDLHLTSSARDEYRWGLFPWLRDQAHKLGAKRIVILGDITDAKDYHSSLLVNRLVQNLVMLAEANLEILLLRGNHDGIDPEWPFFRFTTQLMGVNFVYKPEEYADALLLPHSRDPAGEWKDLQLKKFRYVLAHATVEGSLAESGVNLRGVPKELFADARQVYSGDVHVPQRVGNVEYVGAPYPIRFGDDFKARCIVFRDGQRDKDIHYETLARWMLVLSSPEQMQEYDVGCGDQVKVRLELPRQEVLNWEKHRRRVIEICSREQLELCGLELVVQQPENSLEKLAAPIQVKHQNPQELLKEFCASSKVEPELQELGAALLEETEK